MYPLCHSRNTVLSLLSALALSACYRAETINGLVVDDTTGKPLGGAVVVANWQASGAGFDPREAGHIAAFETKSDDLGKFHIDSWGPRWHWYGKINKVTATVYVFKSGYQGVAVAKESAAGAGYLANINVAPNPGTVKLRQASASQRERIENFDMFNVKLRPILYQNATCPWSRVPTLLQELHRETLLLLPHSRESGAWPIMTLDQDLIAYSDQLARDAGSSCASPKEIFQLQSGP